MQEFEGYLNHLFDKMCFKNPHRRQTLKKKELNVFLASNFKIYRMMTTIWYNVVLDNTMMTRLQHALCCQLELIHDNIISNQIEEAPMGNIEDVKLIIQKFMLCVLDISINENSVHFLAHSNVVLDHAYEMFEDLLLDVSWKFIKSVCEKVYNKHMIRELRNILSIYSRIMHEFGPLRFK